MALMNVWSPASWQKIQREVYAKLHVKPDFEGIEAFIEERELWDSDPEEIVSALITDLFEK
jgi:hypothetical protein